MEWLSKGALPIGILMFVGMLVSLLLRRHRFRHAAQQFPALAEKLGLDFKASPHQRMIGTLSGTYGSYRVFIDPDDQRRIAVRFEHEPKIDLRNYEHSRRALPGMHAFFSGDKRFDSFFKPRHVSDELAERLLEIEHLHRLLDPFRGPYCRQLKQLNVTSNGVSCVLDFGNPPHIPAAAVEFLLPAMVELAKAIEPHQGGPVSG